MYLHFCSIFIKRYVLILIAFIFLVFTTPVYAANSVDIAILTDGPSTKTDLIIQQLKTELDSITGSEFQIRYPSQLQRQGNWDIEVIRTELNQLMSQKGIDVIVTLGLIGSSMTAEILHSTPIIAPFVIDAKLQGFPITDSGGSGVTNLHYLSNNRNLLAELERFEGATGAEHIAVIADSRILDALPTAREKLERAASKLNIKLSIINAANTATPLLASLPQGIDAVFFLPLLRFPEKEQVKLIDGLIARQLPSYTIVGRPLVEQGMLMGSSMLPSTERLARQLAIDIRDILLGRKAGSLPVSFDTDSRLVLNMRTARALNYAPPFEVLYEADLMHQGDEQGRVLTLESAVREALDRNLSYAIAKEELLSAEQSTRVARSALLPQLSASVNTQAFDRDIVGLGPDRTTSAGLNLSQVIYSESARANYHISQRLEVASAADLDGVKLDIIQQAAQAYLNVLVAKTQLNIQRDNLKVTRANLERAEFRLDVGSTDRSEVYRFETALGGNRQDVANAQALYLQTQNQLNQILKQPIEASFQTIEPGLYDPEVFGDPRLEIFISDPQKARIFRDFLAKESLANAPELVALDEQIAAQERSLLATKRARYIPDVSLTSSLERVIDYSGAQAQQSYDEDWSVGLQFSLPLFQGGKLDADRQQAQIELHRLQLLREQFNDQIETAARIAVHQAGASRQNIQFASNAAMAAKKTLDLVTDSYTRGTASDTDLIDAQNAALVAQLSSAQASYQFLLDLMDVQRAIGFFDFFVDPGEKESWFQRLDAFAIHQLQGQAR